MKPVLQPFLVMKTFQTGLTKSSPVKLKSASFVCSFAPNVLFKGSKQNPVLKMAVLPSFLSLSSDAD